MFDIMTGMDPVFDEKKIKIKFEGQTHQIDVNTLASSLMVFSETLKEINTELRTNKNIEIKIEALAPGSFEIHTIVSAINESGLLGAMCQIGGAAGLISMTYQGIVGLRSWFKKENREIEEVKQEENQTIITTKNGNTYICDNVIYNTYNNSQLVNDSISDQFRILEEDPAINGLTLSIDGQESLSVQKDDFSALAQKVEIPGENKRKDIKNSETVYLVKPVLEKSPTRRWEFIWNGNRISANIADINFLEKMEQGEYRFGAGDKMVVDLQINQLLNPIYNAWLNESYQIVLIHEHIPKEGPPKKMSLFDSPE